MNTSLKILHVEDSELDAKLISEILNNEGIHCDITLVSNKNDYVQALVTNSFDLIFSDYSLPDFDGTRALEIARDKARDTPFIIISGELGEELAINALHQGATDYVLKHRIQRLLPAVKRSIEEAENKRKKYEAETELKKSQERYQLAAQGSNDGLWDWDLIKNDIYLSARWKSILGYAETEFPNDVKFWLNQLHPEDQSKLEHDLNLHLQSNKPHLESYHRLRHKDGTYRWVLLRGLAIRNHQNIPQRMAGSMTDVTQRKLEEEELIYNAYHDKLTGLSNRAFFVTCVQRMILNATRKKELTHAVLFLDVDRFKIINDSMGHLTGDLLLIEISQRLKKSLRSTDIAARFGGDEFSVMLNDLNEEADALQTTSRILKSLNEYYTVNNETFHMTVSIGIAFLNDTYKKAEDLLRDADTAMYQAKSLGKAQYQIFDEKMHAKMLNMFHLEKELHKAVLNKSFNLHYQPIVSASTEHIVGFEALIRWNHPEKGNIPPIDFIPLSEELGLILPLGDWIIETACSQLQSWHELGFNHLFMTINCSIKQFQNPEFSALVIKILESKKIVSKNVHLEITESVLMGNEKVVLENIQDLVAFGILFSIDDFGTGYSCLACLNKFPIHTLKIDRSFVKNIGLHNNETSLVRAILSMAKNLEMETVAEGVETRSQLNFLQDNHCNFIQGYYFSKPKPSQEIELNMHTFQSEYN